MRGKRTGHGAHGAHERVDEASTDGRSHVADVDGEAGGRTLELGILAVGRKQRAKAKDGECVRVGACMRRRRLVQVT